jgi:hypothetical protein
MTGTRARVYWLLRLTGERRHYHPMDTDPPSNGPCGWVPIHTLRKPWAGGAQGDRRVRDLQELHGVGYEVRRWSSLGGPEDSSATLYRLTSDPLAALNPLPGGEDRVRQPAPAAAPAARVSSSLPLARIRFWTLAGGRPSQAGTTLCLDPGCGGALAPPVELAARATRGELSSTQADEAYRQHLLGAYRAGDFAAVSGHVHLVVWISSSGAPWGPLPAFSRALVALGAEHAGTWEAVA